MLLILKLINCFFHFRFTAFKFKWSSRSSCLKSRLHPEKRKIGRYERSYDGEENRKGMRKRTDDLTKNHSSSDKSSKSSTKVSSLFKSNTHTTCKENVDGLLTNLPTDAEIQKKTQVPDLNSSEYLPQHAKQPNERIDNVIIKTPSIIAPSVNTPTLYSQRMYRKIYNIDPPNILNNRNSQIQKDASNSVTYEAEKIENNAANENCPDLYRRKDEHSSSRNVRNPSSASSIAENLEKSVTISVHNDPITNKESMIDFLPPHLDGSTNIRDNIIVGEIATGNEATNETRNTSCHGLQKKSTEGAASIQPIVNKHNLMSETIKRYPNASSNLSSTLASKVKNRHSNKTAFSPISAKWNESRNKNNLNKLLGDKKEENSSKQTETAVSGRKKESNPRALVEELFGSSLKWADNSTEEVTKLCIPLSTFEDSCSAQIENAKFKNQHLRTNTCAVVSNFKKVEVTASTTMQTGSHTKISVQDASDKHYRPFKQINNTRVENHFSIFHATASGVSSMSSSHLTTCENIGTTKLSPINSPKYNDSILGQFDDTTQLISALAKDHSKISPIHTPVKERSEKSAIRSNSASPENSVHPSLKTTSPLQPRTSCINRVDRKTILLEEPINILSPRRKRREVISIGSPRKRPKSQVSKNVEYSKENREVSPKIVKNVSSQVGSKKPEVGEVNNSPSIRERPDKIRNFLNGSDSKQQHANDLHSHLRFPSSEERSSLDVSNEKMSDNAILKVGDIVKCKEKSECTSSKSRDGSFEMYYDERGRKKVKFITISSKLSQKKNSPGKVDRSVTNNSRVTFKRPLSHENSRNRNCFFRETSVERKFIKDTRHTSRSRYTPVRQIRKISKETHLNRNQNLNDISPERKGVSDSLECTSIPHNESTTEVRSLPLLSPEETQSPQITRIVRSSKKISWSSTTTEVVSAKVQESKPVSKTESLMKWVLKPIDFTINNQPSSCQNIIGDTKAFPDKAHPDTILKCDSTTNQTDENKDLKKTQTLVIISRRRPAKFGVSEM